MIKVMHVIKFCYFCIPKIEHIMEVFLMAAGLGTRLRPLTLHKPKALVEVAGRTLLQINIEQLVRQGASRIVVNVHHFASMMKDFIASHHWDCEVVVSDESAMLMDTGGGLKKAAPLFSRTQPILVYNVDVLSDISVQEMMSQHLRTKALATLAVSQRNTQRYLLFNMDNRLVGWRNKASGEERWARQAVRDCNELAFSGMAVVEPEMLDLLPPADAPYAIVPEYLRLANQHIVNGFCHPAAQWLDVGKPETLPLAKDFLTTIEQDNY